MARTTRNTMPENQRGWKVNIQDFFDDYQKTFWQDSQEETEAFLRRSIARAEAEKDEHSLVTILNEAAGYFRNVSKCAEAIKAADRALGILERLGYQDGVPYGTTLLNAATAYRAGGQSQKALDMFRASLALLEKRLPATDHRLAAVYNNISAIHQEQGRLPEALECLRKAVDILESNTELTDDTAIVLTNLAMLLLRVERGEEALAGLEKATALFRRAARERGDAAALAPQYAAAMAGMGEVHFRLKEFGKAARCYEEAIEHIRAAFGENQDFVTTCRNCAEALAANGEMDKAAEMRARADKAGALLQKAAG